jgi:hypothetical protein
MPAVSICQLLCALGHLLAQVRDLIIHVLHHALRSFCHENTCVKIMQLHVHASVLKDVSSGTRRAGALMQ